MNDEILIKKIIQGDEAAFQELYDKYHRTVYYVAYKTMHNEADAQDVLQDTFLQIQKSIHTVKKAEFLKMWIIRITINKCNMIYRKRKEVLFEEDDKNPMLYAKEKDYEYLPEENLHFQTDQELLLHFINELPAAQRLMITLMYFQHMSVEEIAHACDIPTGTVKSRCKVARDTLKKKIELYEKLEHTELNFKADSLGALIIAAFLIEESQVAAHILPCIFTPISSFSKLLRNFHWHNAGIVACCTATAISCYGVYSTISDQEFNHPEQYALSDSKYPMDVDSLAHDAYYEIIMWANTPTVLEAKKDQIKTYQKYYEILKDEQGVYWNLFLQHKLQNYFEK